MNHYDRLKVTPDAPLEVIQAAYEAWVRMAHLDDQDGGVGSERIAAVHAAYKVLSDPSLRNEYDAAMIVQAIASGLPPQAPESALESEAGKTASQDELGRWNPNLPEPNTPTTRNRTTLAMGAAGVVLLFGAVWATWGVVSRHKMERALSEQYAAQPRATAHDLLEPPRPAALRHPAPDATHSPTAAELSKMSDEQLLEVLPILGQPGASRPATLADPRLQRNEGLHPLDGQSLNLRIETQLLAPSAPAAASKSN
ncbi:MAG: DnaJ domain-containing protein [Burkholderiales bacterium]|nr:DnaJ domain-containing protein [Burkholderiales bacterium]